MSADTEPQVEGLLTYLKEQRGFDFTGYKRASLVRRIRRRMTTVGIDGFVEYQDYLAVHPEEFAGLFNTILINVTSFFRDADSWHYLSRDVLPRLLADKDGQPIRAWCAGCASGEEAYTLAMLLAEALGMQQFTERVKIYATDVDEEALAAARQAVYDEQQIRFLPDELAARYLEGQNGRFAVTKELRRCVIFGRNDLVRDAPISHVDILTCRNTLMYFNAETQAQILQRLHFALEPGGVLFLGKAEMLLSHAGLFRPLEVTRRVFAKVVTGGRQRRQSPPLAILGQLVDTQQVTDRLSRAALAAAPAAHLVLDLDGRLTMANARASHLFGLTSDDIGRPIQDLEVSYRPLELRPSLDEAIRDHRQVWVRDVGWRTGDQEVVLDVQLLPLSDDNGSLFGSAVIFNDVTHHRQLQRELGFANRQLETAYEELQSTNEELETTNEELQSTVEELETMNEELQSMNDQLHLSNEALQEHQQEVDRLNRFLDSVLNSMSAGIAVVDGELQVLAWSAKAQDLWGIRPEEAVGQHLFTLDIGLPLEQLRPVLRDHLGDGSPEQATVLLDAVNRRGRQLRVQVTVTRLDGGLQSTPGVILVMNVVPAGRPDEAALDSAQKTEPPMKTEPQTKTEIR